MGACASSPAEIEEKQEPGAQHCAEAPVEQVQCKFCNERPSGSFKATSLERLKWTKDEKQWCHRSCLEKSEQDYQQYIVERYHFSKAKQALFPRLKVNISDLKPIASQRSWRDTLSFQLVPSSIPRLSYPEGAKC
ncbi:hypothetical protein ACKKBF_B05060 [Auxenochlorella protothecoides x Auxenochlorella symbiontica]